MGPFERWINQGQAEPSAGLRTGTNIIRQFHLALIQQGFTEDQALHLTGQFVHATFSQTRNRNQE